MQATASDESERLLTVKEVAEMCRVHEVTIRRHIRDGRLPVLRAGRALRVRRSDVERFLSPVPEGVDPKKWGLPMLADDPLWAIIGMGDSGGPGDVSANKYKYLYGAPSQQS
jgi:excisionase family DNA binding protein